MNAQNVTFQQASTEHLDALVALMREMQADDPWSCEFTDQGAREAARNLILDPSLGRIWMICIGHDAVGYIALSFDYSLEYGGKCGWVDEFFVRREHRGKGIGSRALEFFAVRARELGARTLHLGVRRGNPAIDLYRRAGFREHDAYVMTKWLTEPD
ncbi:MAG TPA: GNAT family N-acetyltransferase [Terriglobales bacterium]|nr:GNAT family N-acetyltransferase [Terriglobales bacterium]